MRIAIVEPIHAYFLGEEEVNESLVAVSAGTFGQHLKPLHELFSRAAT